MANKKKKKKVSKKTIKNIFKLIGLGVASVFALMALSVGIFALCGGFREKVVSLQGMNFDRTAYVLVGTSDKDGNVIDNSVTLKPTNEDATKLDVILSADDNNSVEFEKDENGRSVGKVGTPLKIKIIQESDEKGNYNRSGEFVLTAIQEEDLIYASTNIFVESPVKSFVLSASNIDTNKIYPGTSFTVSAQNLFPSNSLAKPSKQIFYDVYGENYFTKQVLYFSSNESVAHVDMLTGEVNVLAVGDFTIFAYMATTYENNSKIMPRESYESDVEYFAELDKLAIKQEIVNLKSKSIEVAGISATTNSFNLIVNRDYSYSASGTYEGTTTPIDLDISLIPPGNSKYTANQLKYKLEDVQIFEGYKSGSNFFISKNQTYTPNKIESTYLDIEKSSNPLYWKVTPRYYTNDRYLIIRIAKTPIKTDITENILAEDVDGDEYIYYAYVKIDIQIIENQTLKLSVDNLLATYDSSNPMAEYDLKVNGDLLNLYDYISEITPNNATYKKVRFFVENKENCPLVLDGETNLIQLYDADGNIDSNGQYIKATKSGSVKIYASIYSEDRNGVYKDELIKSRSLTLMISSEVNLTDFALKKGTEPATEIKDIEINKGEEVVLSFKVTNSNGFKDAYDLDLFNIKSDIENIVTNMITLPTEENGNVCSVVITGVNVGSTQISVVFNGKVYVSFKIDVKSNAVKSLKILENTTIVDELVFVIPDLLPKQLFVSIDGGNVDSKVSLQTINADNEKVEIALTDTLPQQITVTPKKLCENISFYVYIVENGIQIKSQIVTIKIKMPEDFEVIAKRNNTVYINTLIYEQVIADTEFVVLANENSFLNIKGLSNSYFTLVSDTLLDTETPLYDDVSNKFYNVSENTKCKITLKTTNDVDFWNEEDYLEFYFNIIPKYSIKSISKDVEAGQVYSLSELKSLINLYENTYSDSVPTDAYKGKITQSLLSGNIKVFEDEDKLNEITEDYLVSVSSFANSKITLYAVVSYNNGKETITKDGVIILNVSSNLNIVSDAVINNGELVTLTNLFKVAKNNVVLPSSDATISKVELTQESFVKLFNEGFKLYDSSDTEITNSENANLVTKIKVPQEFNKYGLENLKARIIASVNGEEAVKQNHEFNLAFKLTTLELTNVTKIYLDKSSDVTINLSGEVTGLQESAKTNLINSFVITARESAEEGEIKNVLSSVDVVLDVTNNKILFKLNQCVTIVDYELVENFATPKALTSSIVAKSYAINDLLESDYTDIIIYKVTNSSGADVIDTDAIIENNGTSVYFKNGGTYNIIFKILGREKQIINNLNVEDITVYLNSFDNIYSNVNFDLFKDDVWTKIINNDLKYDIEILKEDGVTKLEDGIVNISYNSATKRSILQVLNYMGATQKVIVRVKLYSSNSVGIIREKQVDLQKLYIYTRFTELNGDRQILLNKFTYNLLDYFNVEGAYTNLFYNLSTEGSDVSYLDNSYLNNFMVNVTDENLNITLKLKENGEEKIIKVIGFYIEDLTLNVDSISEIEDKQTYFVGQILTKQDLLQFVTIKNKINANIEKYNDKIIFKDVLDDEITEFILTSDLATNNKLNVYFGAQSKELSIPANLVLWTNYNGDTLVNPNYDVYPDTKITEYVKAKVGSSELNINFKPVDSNISKFENGIYTIKSNDNSYLGTINSKTGEIIIDVPTLASAKTFTIISFVEGASDIASCKKQIEFNVLPLTKNVSNPTMNVYIGDNETEFSDNNYFLQGTNHLTNIDYIVTNINSSVEQDTYSHRINSLTNSDDILKNGKTVASIIVKSGSRKVFKCTSNLDAMEITLRGYLKLTGTGGYKLESLNNNYIEIKVNALKIDINLNYSNIITVDNVTYYVLKSTNDKDFKIDITAKQDDTALDFNNIEINTSIIPFVADVTNNAGSLAYNKKIYNINGVARYGFSTFNGTNVNLSHDTDYHFTLNKGLVEYIFMQISYSVESYSGTYNICLKPTNTITFVYNSESNNIKDVYAPSNYTIGRNSELLTFSDTNIVNLISSENIKITFSQTETGGYLPSIDGITLAKVGENYQIQLTNEAKENCFIKVSIKNGATNYEYIYRLKINVAKIEVWTDKSINLENSASSPISITSSQVMDLKDYIYVNGEQIVLNSNKDFINSLTFPEIENEKYTLKNNGELTCLSSFVNESLDINFQLLGKTYTIYLKGDEVTVTFKYEGTNLTDEQDYTLESGLNYYIASNKGATEYLLDVNLSRTSTISGLDAIVTISNLKYTIGESVYNDQNLFTNSDGVYYFSGQALIRLIRNTNNYSLIVSSELDGNLEFDISIKYRSITIGKHASVTIQNLNINYIEPVIYNNTQYQNVVAGSSFDLSTLISGIKSESLSSLTYKINGLDSTGISINGSVIYAEANSVFEDKYLTIVVGFESVEKYINVKIVPQYKPSTIQNKFVVLKNEVVNYYDYFKLYKFARFDSQMMPVYNMVSYTNNLKQISSKTSISIGIFSLSFDVLNEDVISEDTYQITVGESVNLINLLKPKFDTTTLTNKTLNGRNITFVDNNNFVNADGIFTPTFVETDLENYAITININGYETTINFAIKNLEIKVEYKNSINLFNEETNQQKCYENIYATQTLVLKTDGASPTYNYIKLSNNDYYSNINYAIEIEDCGSLIRKNFTITETNLKYNDVTIFKIENGKMICSADLTNEIKLNIKITIKNNIVVENYFNVRLMPVSLNINQLIVNNELEINNKNLDSSNAYNLIYNVFYAQTTCDSNNINLNDVIKVYEVKEEGGVHELISGNKYYFARANKSITVYATINDELQSALVNINYINEEANGNATIFVGNTASENSSVLQNGIVTAVRSTNVTKITYTTNLNGTLYYSVYDSNNELLFKIASNGTITNIDTTKSFTVLVEANYLSYTETRNISYIKTGSQITLKSDERYVTENGVKVLTLLSGEKYDCSNLINGNSFVIEDGKYANVSFDETSVKAIITSVTTYGYFTVTNETTECRIYVKIIPINLGINKPLDYTFSGIVTLEDDPTPIINDGDKFITIYTYNTYDRKVDLNSYITNFIKNLPYTQTYEIEYAVANTESGYIDVKDNNSYYTLSNNLLTLKNNGEYFIKIIVKIENLDDVAISLRVKSIKTRVETTKTVNNNSSIEINNIIYDLNSSDAEITFNLINSTNSYISNNVLYVSEDCSKTIYLYYGINGYFSESVKINVQNETLDINNYLLGNKSYKQLWYGSNNLDSLYITNIISASLNGTKYDNISVTSKKSDDGENLIITYTINNLLEINCMIYARLGICGETRVKFYDKNSNTFIDENKLGVILLEFEYLNGNIKTIGYFKLNDYDITKNESSVFKYTKQGIEIEDVLKFSLVDENGLVISGTTINDETIISNGITLNIWTGEVSGTKINASKNMYIKAYVPQENYNSGENYKLFKI